MEVEIDITKSVDENAASYFERAKKAKRKLKGAVETIARFEAKRESVGKETVQKTSRKKKRKQLWFEKFRWFITSTGFLVIGGRDATTNELAIKRHAKAGDLVFHTDMAGSPFFIIQAEGKQIDEQTIAEVADATCSFSRAWKTGMHATSVFYVKPDQVTKEANTGEFLSKGAFVIRGQTTYVDNKINLAIGCISKGQYEGLILCAPKESAESYCEKKYLIRQGNDKPSDIAKKLKKEFDATADEIVRALPSDNIELVRERPRKHDLPTK